MPVTVPALMPFLLRNCVAFSACVSLIVICSCEKHEVGEMPDVQKERGQVANQSATPESGGSSPTPSAKPTPVDFFPTKPR
jgi:hypothetical protein